MWWRARPAGGKLEEFELTVGDRVAELADDGEGARGADREVAEPFAGIEVGEIGAG